MTNYIIPTILIIVVCAGVSLGVFNLCDGLYTNTALVKVKDLQAQQLFSGHKDNMKTKIRYLVITDSKTFVIEDSYLKFKFNNSDIFYHLQKDSTYSLKVQGIGKTLLSDYRNILKINKQLTI